MTFRTYNTVAATAKWWSTAAVVVRGNYVTDVFLHWCCIIQHITVLRHLFKNILLNVPFTAQNLLVNSALQSGWRKAKVSLELKIFPVCWLGMKILKNDRIFRLPQVFCPVLWWVAFHKKWTFWNSTVFLEFLHRLIIFRPSGIHNCLVVFEWVISCLSVRVGICSIYEVGCCFAGAILVALLLQDL